MTCDGRLFHRRAAATGNALSPTVDRRVRRTSRDVTVDKAERSRRLASASAGRRTCSSSHRYVGTRPCWHFVAYAKTGSTTFTFVMGCFILSAEMSLPNSDHSPLRRPDSLELPAR